MSPAEMPMSAVERKQIETKVITVFIEDALAAGFKLGVHDGEELVLRDSTDKEAVLAALFSVDEERLIVYSGLKRHGTVFLVHGNDGWDVIADYSTSLEPLMKRVDEVSNKLSDEWFNAK